MHHLFGLDPLVDLLPTSNAFNQSLLFVSQPTIVDKQQIWGAKSNKTIGFFVRSVYLNSFLSICCLSTITAKKNFVTDCLKSLNLRWTHHLPKCWNATCVYVALLSSFSLFCFCYFVFFEKEDLEKGHTCMKTSSFLII